MHQKIQILKQELQEELNNILNYWMEHTIDETNGGFYGSVLNDNSVKSNAAKGVVLNARILWTFSAACNFQKDQQYLVIAERAMHYIIDHFGDKEYGGVYWSVDAKGNMLEGRKQIYGLAFCIYGMSEYYAATKNRLALQYAIELYKCIELHSYDTVHKGYFEAFSKEWQSLNDLRLSAKDANEKKTLNTHLHIIEAYANLYKVWPDETLKDKIEELLYLFDQRFINHETGHLRLFFDEHWKEKVDVISYGHDIEAAWLLLQCAEIIQHDFWLEKFKKRAIAITQAAMRGLDKDGGLWYEYEQHTKHLIKEKHWWPQAEAMIGFFNACQLSRDEKYIELALQTWQFIKDHLLDKNNGEWYWGVTEDYSIMEEQDKAGFWKCPYHNARACMEILQRIKLIDSIKVVE
ncbi:cellobiose 2-epimerase [soil metagenome]